MRRLTIQIIAFALCFGLSISSWSQGLTPPGLLGGEGDIPVEPIEPDAEDFQGKKVVDVEVKGHRRVSPDDIRVNIGTRQGMLYDKKRVARDIRALYDLGFFSDIEVNATSTDEGVILTYTVDEKPAVNEIVLEGNDEIDEEDITEVLDIEANKPLDIPTIHKNVQKIRDLYSEKGFFLAQVTYRLKEAGENAYDVVFIIDEHAQVEVRRISFVGNHELKDSQLTRYLSTRTAGPLSILTDSGKFKREMFDRDLTVISALYWDYGYLKVQVGTPRVELSPDRRYIFLSIPIEEGPRFKVGRIKVVEHDDNGNEVEMLDGRRRVRSMVFTERGKWFSRTSVMEDVNRITRHYQDHGYAHVNVELKTLFREDDEKVVDLELDISRGPLVFFERIDIRGNTKTRDRVIRREVLIHEGEKYSQTGIDRSKARVTQLGYFETVDITTSPGSAPDKMKVTVEVVEKHTGQFQVGMGFSSIEQFIAQAQVTEQNFLGQGQTLSLQVQMSGMRQIFMFNFWEPYFLDSNWTLAFRLFNTIMAQVDYNRESTGGEITLGHSIGLRDLKLYLSYNLEYDKVNTGSNSGLLIAGRRLNSGFQNLPLAHLFKEGLSSSVKSLLAYDRRNNRLFPTDGSYHSLSVEWASPYIGSKFSFTRYSANTRWYFPLFWKFVFRLNGSFGLIHAHGSEGLAIVHRYRSGGIMDVRGFYPWSLGPKLSIPNRFDPNAEPLPYGLNIGGNMKVTINTEIEFPIIEIVGIKGVVFFDAGNSFNLEDTWCQAGGGRGINKFTDPCNHNPLYLRTSAGFGFRWFSPMGPLRFEWGWPTHPQPGEEPMQFEFTFGNFF
ncbi:MAG: outer membrane protein assembly factor BamA [Deltaproteobacteria bacterium]|nr:outer membrane protein assembly factor BamA [Deltaproteobacteria bacterium]